MSGSDRDARAARLAEALRENLRRRKTQARSRGGAAVADVPGGEPAGSGGAGATPEPEQDADD